MCAFGLSRITPSTAALISGRCPSRAQRRTIELLWSDIIWASDSVLISEFVGHGDYGDTADIRGETDSYGENDDDDGDYLSEVFEGEDDVMSTINTTTEIGAFDIEEVRLQAEAMEDIATLSKPIPDQDNQADLVLRFCTF